MIDNQKKYIIYYNESKDLIGVREHHFDWQEGEEITTDGVKTTIFGIFEGTERNIELAIATVKTTKKKYPFFREHLFPGDDVDEDDEDEVLDAAINQQIRDEFAPNYKWKDFDAKLDFVDSVMAEMDE